MLGMFGNRKPQLPFGAQMPDIGSGAPPLAPTPQQPPMSLGMGYQAPQQQPHGFNAPGGWADKLGGIGALLLSAGGNPAGPQMFQQMDQRRQQAMLQQQALAARYAPQHVGDSIIHLGQDGKYVTDWTNPGAGPTPTEIERLAQAAGYIPGSPEYQAILRNAVNEKSDPAQIVAKGDGSFFPVRHSEMYGAPSMPAPPGVTFTPIPAPGGAGVQAPARFPGSVMDAVISQESGGRPGVLGPQTQYGRAQGLSQMLPATAQQMAAKLGLPWRPDLMTGKDSTAAAYQRQLGQAYLQQGMEATGNLPDALRYYHGGPSPKLWGPKTNAYARNVLSRLGQQPATQQSAAPTNPDAGYQGWLKKYGIREDPTYDTRAAFNAGLKPDSRGHLNDTYKLPNHPTFSDESIHSGQDGKVGGQWVQLAPKSRLHPEGTWEFRASPWNVQNTPKAELKAYFDRVEPGTAVIFPDGERYVGKAGTR